MTTSGIGTKRRDSVGEDRREDRRDRDEQQRRDGLGHCRPSPLAVSPRRVAARRGTPQPPPGLNARPGESCETVIVAAARRLTTSGRRESMAPLFGMGVGVLVVVPAMHTRRHADDRARSSTRRGCRIRSARPPRRATPRRTIWCRAARGRICWTRWPRRPRSSRTNSVGAQRGRPRRRVSAPARPAVARGRPGAARRDRPRARRQPLRASTTSTSGAWTAPTASTRARRSRGGETYRIWGNRGSARYVGLQSMAGMASSANVLLDELDLGPGGEVELTLSTERHEGNWLPIAENATSPRGAPLLLRLGHRGGVVAVDRAGGRGGSGRGDPGQGGRRRIPREVAARQLIAIGDFVLGNLEFFLQFSRPETPNTLPPAARRHGHGGGRREPPGHRLVRARAGRGVGGGGDAARRACTGATRWGTRGGRRSTTPGTRAA